MVTQTKSYLCESVLVQKALAKLGRVTFGESSQGAPAMARLEVASQFYSEGRRVGLNVMRVPATRMKHGICSPANPPGGSIRILSLAYQVRGVVTWRKWHLILTSEVPHRLYLQQSKRGP